MDMNEKNSEITVMDFSGVYKKEQFQEEASWMDVSKLSGTNCYCDEEAFWELKKKILEVPFRGIHFMDSGNYHYMSRIWLEMAEEPVTLIVFDNHTDMQPPAFGGILSCGGWIASALEELPLVCEVLLIGPDEEAFSQVEPELQKKVKFLSREKLQELDLEGRRRFFQEALGKEKRAIYLSVDKDVLAPGEADTSWSQGDLTLSELLDMLKIILSCAQQEGRELLGVDICGESEGGENREENIRANKELIRCLERLFVREKEDET